MPTIVDILQLEPNEMQPEWLYAHEKPRFNRNAFFGSRTIYYPGSGDDGQPVKFCALSHVAHAFVYVDQEYRWNTLAERLAHPEYGFSGYEPVHHEDVSQNQLRPGGWTQHVEREEVENSDAFRASFANPFARFAVLERQGDNEDHGPKRIAILFICGDGFASFDALYCQEDDIPPPFLIVIQDCGFGGNYGRFDRGGLLERIACRTGVLPEFLLVANCSEPWSGYMDTGAVAEPGGQHAHPRRLFRRKSLQEKSSYEKEIRFFSELSPHIEYASIFDRELSRRVAHKFNVFDFLDKREVGLSQIIAHLLNPLASHGQGTIFLQHFLEFVNCAKNWNHLTSHTVNVETEHSTYQGRRIDIYVEILGETPFVLAIENKPYAGDQENQVLDYLKYLEKKTTDFLLVYLSPSGQGPSEWSFPQDERSEWSEKFTAMAYAESGGAPDQIQDTEEQSEVQHEEENQEVKSLATWLKICKEKCEVDRLRWFLGDAENFCTKTFGNSKSTDDVEVRIVEEFLLEKENQKYLNAAYAVNKAWPNVVNKVAEIFFRQLTERIKIEIKKNYSARDDLKFNFSLTFDEDRKGYIYMYLYSTNWVESKNGKFHTENRYGIVLTNETKNTPDKWYVGVESPKKKEHMEHHEQYRFEEVKVKLNALKIPRIEGDDYSDPGYVYAEDDKQNWEQFLKKLLDESEQKRGEISDYYVRFFCKFADEAISILDEIE